MAGAQRTKGEKERKTETKSLKPPNANALSAVSPVEDACLKLQQLTMDFCLCQCPHTKATVVFKRLASRTEAIREEKHLATRLVS